MGRMADARKRARREGAAAPSPAAENVAAALDPAAPPAEAEIVFPAEPQAPDAAGTGGAAGLKLPASGLAEDILRQLPQGVGEAADAVAAPEPEPPASAASEPARIELPASGLAEEILARTGALPGPEPEAASPAPAPHGEAPAAAPTAVPGAHSLSFFAAPVQDQRAAAEATEHLVTFFLDREEYGMDVRQVQEIRRLTEITTVPRAPEFIRGVINLRGRILPVLDLKRKLGLGEVAESRAARIVVVRVRERLIGLLVDGASQVPKIPVSRIEAAPEEVVERGGDYIRGVAKLDDRLIILVDLERLLAHELRGPTAPAPAGSGAAPAGSGADHDGAS